MRCALVFLFVTMVVGGCASSPFHRSDSVAVECIVESFEPKATVLYTFDFCSQFAETSLSHLRVLSPADLKDKLYAIDLGASSDIKELEDQKLANVGSTVRIFIPIRLTRSKPEDLIPVSLLRLEPNQSLEPTPNAVTHPADAGCAPASGVAQH